MPSANRLWFSYLLGNVVLLLKINGVHVKGRCIEVN